MNERDLFSIASPTTLASLIADIEQAKNATHEQKRLHQLATTELELLVGRTESVRLITLNSERNYLMATYKVTLEGGTPPVKLLTANELDFGKDYVIAASPDPNLIGCAVFVDIYSTIIAGRPGIVRPFSECKEERFLPLDLEKHTFRFSNNLLKVDGFKVPDEEAVDTSNFMVGEICVLLATSNSETAKPGTIGTTDSDEDFLGFNDDEFSRKGEYTFRRLRVGERAIIERTE